MNPMHSCPRSSPKPIGDSLPPTGGWFVRIGRNRQIPAGSADLSGGLPVLRTPPAHHATAPGARQSRELTAALPSGVRFEPAQSDAPCIESGRLVTCSFASWDANAAGILRIAVTPSAAGALQLTFTVRAAERDPDLSNNSQTESTMVVAPTEAEVSIDLPTSLDGYAGQNFIWLGVEV